MSNQPEITSVELNKVAELLEANGIKATKEVVLSVCIKTLVDAGMDIRAAFDRVMGAGQYELTAGGIYNALRA